MPIRPYNILSELITGISSIQPYYPDGSANVSPSNTLSAYYPLITSVSNLAHAGSMTTSCLSTRYPLLDNGTIGTVAPNTAALTGSGVLIEGQGENLCTNYNLKPTSTINITVQNNAVVSIVNASTSLASSGLSSLLDSGRMNGNVFRVVSDPTVNNSSAFVVGKSTDDAPTMFAQCWVRVVQQGEQELQLRLSNDVGGGNVVVSGSEWKQYFFTGTAQNGFTRNLQLSCAGTGTTPTIFEFIANQFEYNSWSSLIEVQGSASTRNAVTAAVPTSDVFVDDRCYLGDWNAGSFINGVNIVNNILNFTADISRPLGKYATLVTADWIGAVCTGSNGHRVKIISVPNANAATFTRLDSSTDAEIKEGFQFVDDGNGGNANTFTIDFSHSAYDKAGATALRASVGDGTTWNDWPTDNFRLSFDVVLQGLAGNSSTFFSTSTNGNADERITIGLLADGKGFFELRRLGVAYGYYAVGNWAGDDDLNVSLTCISGVYTLTINEVVSPDLTPPSPVDLQNLAYIGSGVYSHTNGIYSNLKVESIPTFYPNGLYYPMYSDGKSTGVGSITTSRLSPKNIATTNGIVTIPANVGAYASNHVSGSDIVAGDLIEGQGENLVPYSEDFSHGSWNKNGTASPSVSSGYDSPNGGTDAYRFLRGSSSGSSYLSVNISYLPDTTYSSSMFVKADTAEWVALRIQAPYGDRYDLRYRFSDGSIIDSVSGSIVNTGHHITNLSNGWVRISISGEWAAVSASSATISFNNTGIWIDGHEDSDASGYVYGAQVSVGLSSYIPTNGSPATRNADTVTMPTSDAFVGECYSGAYTTGTFTNGIYRRANDFVMAMDSGGKYELKLTTEHVGCVLDGNPDYTITSVLSGSRAVVSCLVSDTQASLEVRFGNDGTNTNRYPIDFSKSAYNLTTVKALRNSVGDFDLGYDWPTDNFRLSFEVDLTQNATDGIGTYPTLFDSSSNNGKRLFIYQDLNNNGVVIQIADNGNLKVASISIGRTLENGDLISVSVDVTTTDLNFKLNLNGTEYTRTSARDNTFEWGNVAYAAGNNTSNSFNGIYSNLKIEEI